MLCNELTPTQYSLIAFGTLAAIPLIFWLGRVLPGVKMLHRKSVALGEGRVIAFTLIEIKCLFSIIFYKWETIDQVRFHTHAFASIAFLLCGGYDELVIGQDGKMVARTVSRPFWPRWIPRNYCHSIKQSRGLTLSMIIAGPWQKTWWEHFPGKLGGRPAYWQLYGWGRQKLRQVIATDDMKVPGDVRRLSNVRFTHATFHKGPS